MPPLPSRLGKTTRRKKIDGTPLIYTVEDEVLFVAPSNPRKAFCAQKLRLPDGSEEFRICYYMIAHKPRMKGRWAFGQYAPFMTFAELTMMIEKVKAKGWLPESS